MVNKVHFSDQPSNAEIEGAVPLPKKAPAEKIYGAHKDDQIYVEGSPTDFVLEESEEEAEADAPGRMVFATLNMDEDYDKDASIFTYNTTQMALIVLFTKTQ